MDNSARTWSGGVAFGHLGTRDKNCAISASLVKNEAHGAIFSHLAGEFSRQRAKVRCDYLSGYFTDPGLFFRKYAPLRVLSIPLGPVLIELFLAGNLNFTRNSGKSAESMKTAKPRRCMRRYA